MVQSGMLTADLLQTALNCITLGEVPPLVNARASHRSMSMRTPLLNKNETMDALQPGKTDKLNIPEELLFVIPAVSTYLTPIRESSECKISRND